MQKTEFRIRKCGLMILQSHSNFAASPDALGTDYVVEIECPDSERCVKDYVCNGQITDRYKAQLLLQMLAANVKKGLFYVADPTFGKNNNIAHMLWFDYNETAISELIENANEFSKTSIYPLLH